MPSTEDGEGLGAQTEACLPRNRSSDDHLLQTYPEPRGFLLGHPHRASPPSSERGLKQTSRAGTQSRSPFPVSPEAPVCVSPEPFRIPTVSSHSQNRKAYGNRVITPTRRR